MRERREPGFDRLRGVVAPFGLGCLILVLTAQVAFSALATVGAVNVNTANVEELQLLPGVGPARAQAILAARKSKGAFKRIEDLAAIKGIGDSMLDKMRPHIILTGRTTARQEERPPRLAPSGGG
jgi:competence ComEA-like helix-hairpin-helix protein